MHWRHWFWFDLRCGRGVLLLGGPTNPRSLLRRVPGLLPACRSPHRSPDWSNRPWTPRPSGPRCGPEIGQTSNHRAPHGEDAATATHGCTGVEDGRDGGSTACKDQDMRTRTHTHSQMVRTTGRDWDAPTAHLSPQQNGSTDQNYDWKRFYPGPNTRLQVQSGLDSEIIHNKLFYHMLNGSTLFNFLHFFNVWSDL